MERISIHSSIERPSPESSDTRILSPYDIPTIFQNLRKKAEFAPEIEGTLTAIRDAENEGIPQYEIIRLRIQLCQKLIDKIPGNSPSIAIRPSNSGEDDTVIQ